MTDYAHTRYCIETAAKINATRDEYQEKWPHHCKSCGGWGGTEYSFDPSPAGISLASGTMTDFEPCENCICEGICPRCGSFAENFEDETSTCSECGWKDGDDGIPRPHECCCYDNSWLDDGWLESAYEDNNGCGLEVD